jgi:sigma-B regulation protein RsbU (phosphoserine phosphatase)
MAYRRLRARLWLEHYGLFPRTRLAFFTLYVLASALLLLVIEEVGGMFRSSFGSSLSGWVVLLTLLGLVLLAVLSLRRVSSRMLWRMRSRLVLTYAFIGVIPLVLLVVLAALAFYLFSGQFAAYILTSRLDSDLRSLGISNVRLASEIASKVSAHSVTPLSPDAIPSRGANHQVFAWLDGKLIFNNSGEAAPPLPAFLRQDLTRVVQDHGAVFLRSVTTVSGSDGMLVVLSSRPVEQRLLAELGGSLGEVTLYRLDTGTRNPTPIYSAGSIPSPRRTLDFKVTSGAEVPVLDWISGADTNPAPVSVTTRLSQLYDLGFSSLGDLGATIEFVLFLLLIALFLFEAAAWWIGTRLSGSITRAVAQMYLATTHINRGDFSHRIPITSNDQLAALASSFNSMTESIQNLVLEQKEKQRLENEITIAQEVQAQLFPRHITQLPSLEVFGFCRPARSVSGDYYDFLSLGPDRLLLAVGDVSGKGISAALLMATIHSAVRAYSVEGIPALRQLQAVGGGPAVLTRGGSLIEGAEVCPGTLLSLLNHQLYHSTPQEKYATLFLAMYDAETRRLTFSNAGHLPPLVLSKTGIVKRLEDGGTVVGLFDDIRYDEDSVQLRPGEIFLAYSDGVSEPENDFGEFGEERLIELVQENRDLPLERISEIVTAAVDDWIGAAEQPDDVTLVLARAR